MSVDDVARVLLLLPLVDWLAAVILAYVWYRHRDIRTLGERTVAAVILALCASLGAYLGAARLALVDLPEGSVLPLLAIVLVGLTVPNLYWLLLLVTGQLDGPE